jgi:hypothetical protein
MISTLELRLLPCMAADSCAKNAELHHGLLDDVPMTLAPSIVIKEDGRSEIYVHSHFSSVVIDVRWRSMFDRNLYIECKENDAQRNFGPFGIHPGPRRTGNRATGNEITHVGGEDRDSAPRCFAQG